LQEWNCPTSAANVVTTAEEILRNATPAIYPYGVLHRQGKRFRAIERETGIARNTIRAILRGEADGLYGPRCPRPTKIDAYKGYLQERLEAAGKIWLQATVLLREIRAQGYEAESPSSRYPRGLRPAAR
jgi:hypothetical protein